MKTLKLFSFIVCMILCGLTASAQTKVLQTPDEAEYFIKGNLNIQKNASNEIVYTLTNVSTKGITFTMKDVFEGEETEREEIEFDFANATTTYPGGFENNRLNYWRFDEYEQIWIPESEVRQGEMQNTINKYINIMLVLDCSHSLGDGYNVVKSSAKGVIDRLYSASPNGNIRVGIIGFSKIGLTDKQTYPITALNSTTRDNMKKFINNFENDEDQRKGTALYYSLDKSIEMLENDSKSIKEEDYSGSYIITFTDGLDQQSQNIDKDILTSDKYYKHIRPLIQGDARKKIYNKIITHFVRSLKGNDITSDKLEAKFDNDLKAICDDYDKLQNINELSNAFSHILDNLIKRNLELQCFVPKAFEGKVGWTFDEKIIVEPDPREYEKPDEPIKKQNKIFLGINAGVGAGFLSYSSELKPAGDPYDTDFYAYSNGRIAHEEGLLREEGSEFSIPFNVGIDFAFRLADSFYLGAYGSIGMLPCFYSYNNDFGNYISPSFGLLTLFNQKNEKAIIIGAGTCIPNFSTFGMNFRIGYKFKNNLYLFGEFTKYSYDGSYYYSVNDDLNVTSFSFFLHFGYRIF